MNQLSKELVVKEKELAVASKEAEIVLADVAVKAASAEKVRYVEYCYINSNYFDILLSK